MWRTLAIQHWSDLHTREIAHIWETMYWGRKWHDKGLAKNTTDLYVMPYLKYHINLAGFYATCMNVYVEILKIEDLKTSNRDRK